MVSILQSSATTINPCFLAVFHLRTRVKVVKDRLMSLFIVQISMKKKKDFFPLYKEKKALLFWKPDWGDEQRKGIFYQ